MRKELTS